MHFGLGCIFFNESAKKGSFIPQKPETPNVNKRLIIIIFTLTSYIFEACKGRKSKETHKVELVSYIFLS